MPTDKIEVPMLELIDKLMPLTLQVVQERSKEPTFHNVLDVVASCCPQWFLSMEETGVFVSLTTGRRFVQKTHTDIVDQATMDEAILHSLRQLSSFHPAVNIQDLCSLISAAFSFPNSLSSEDVFEKVRCSVESMKVWEKVSMDNGAYKLPLGVTTDEASIDLEAKSIPQFRAVQRPVLSTGGEDPEGRTINTSMVDAAHERATGTEEGKLISSAPPCKFPSPSCRSFFSKIHRHEPEDILAVGSDQVGAISSVTPNIRHQKVQKHRRGKGRNSLFVTVKKNTTRKDDVPQWSLSVVQLLFQRAKLGFGKMTLGNGLRPFAFVEMDSVDQGNKAIGLLNGRVLQGGAFSLVVEWARLKDSTHRY